MIYKIQVFKPLLLILDLMDNNEIHLFLSLHALLIFEVYPLLLLLCELQSANLIY